VSHTGCYKRVELVLVLIDTYFIHKARSHYYLLSIDCFSYCLEFNCCGEKITHTIRYLSYIKENM
jgi:hypothetical protein